MKHDGFLRAHPIFTVEELARHVSAYASVARRAHEGLLAYYRKTGRVVRVRRGLYAVVPPGGDAEAYPIDPFLIAAKLTPDAVLSHHTALDFHGRAHSVREYFTYWASRPVPPLAFRSHVFRGAEVPLALVRAGAEAVGVVTAERAGMNLRVTTLERTLVDVLGRPDLSGGWEEIWRSLESVEYFDLDHVVDYVLLLGSATVAAKVGFYLEQHRESLMVEEGHLEALQRLRPRKPHYLERTRRRPGRLVARWNLVVPEEVLERAWGEVL